MQTDTRNFDVIILGAGVSGLSSAYFLAKTGLSVCILENYSHPGGNHISKTINGYSFDIGSIFFWPDNPQFKMFSGSISQFVPVELTFSRITPQADIQSYPMAVGAELFRRPWALVRTMLSLIRTRLLHKEVASAQGHAIHHMGEYLYRISGLKNYLAKFYGIDPNRVNLHFAARRMNLGNRVSLATAISMLKKWLTPPEKRAPDSGAAALARPTAGFEVHYRHICQQLQDMGVTILCDASVKRVEREDGYFLVHSNDYAFAAERLVNTLPIKKIFSLLGNNQPAEVKSSILCTLCCSFSGDRGFESVVLYNFADKGAWKRLTMHSDYYGRINGREYFSLEIIIDDHEHNIDRLFEDFINHSKSNSIFNGDIRLEGHMCLDYAYPICDLESEDNRKILIEYLTDIGIEAVGRQGAFDYIPHSSIAIEAVRERYGAGMPWVPYQGPPT